MSQQPPGNIDSGVVLDGSYLAASPTPAEAVALAPRGAARASAIRGHEPVIIGTVTVLLFFVVWQGIGLLRDRSPDGLALGPFLFVPPSQLFLPAPLDIAKAFQAYVQDGRIWKDVAVSGQELAIGYVAAAILGIILGLLVGWYARLRYALDPFITFLYATPRIVLLPLFIIWFGIGVESKIAVVFLGAIFANLVKVARSFGASDFQLFRTIALPGSVPFILTGLRLGIGHALTGVVVGELVAAQFGVGQMMAVAGATFQSSKVFAGLFLIAGAGMLMTFTLQRLEQRFQAWRPKPN